MLLVCLINARSCLVLILCMMPQSISPPIHACIIIRDCTYINFVRSTGYMHLYWRLRLHAPLLETAAVLKVVRYLGSTLIPWDLINMHEVHNCLAKCICDISLDSLKAMGHNVIKCTVACVDLIIITRAFPGISSMSGSRPVSLFYSSLILRRCRSEKQPTLHLL